MNVDNITLFWAFFLANLSFLAMAIAFVYFASTKTQRPKKAK